MLIDWSGAMIMEYLNNYSPQIHGTNYTPNSDALLLLAIIMYIRIY
jgi:hypothetical protein